MPELGEVIYYAKRWSPGIGEPIGSVQLNEAKRIFRDCDTVALAKSLIGDSLCERRTHGKRIAFRTQRGDWLGLHLGMTGRLRAEAPTYEPQRHDHLVLRTCSRALVFEDARLFGRVHFSVGSEPEGWAALPPEPSDIAFTRAYFQAILERHSKAPLKAVLLRQECFPGVGNWMADEILWRARLRPNRPASSLNRRQAGDCYTKVREVCQDARKVIGGEEQEELPGFHNDLIPESWLFRHRWRDGGTCPQTGKPLVRETIGGRTTCWSPAWQH